MSKKIKSKKKILDLGCGSNKVLQEAIGVDLVKFPGVDVVHNLNKYPFPFKDNEFDETYAYMILEHLDDVEKSLDEIYRILKPRGILYIKVPYYASQCAFQDPTHKHFFTQKTFDYLTKNKYVILDQKLVANNDSVLEKVRNFVPFRRILKFIFMNMYDEIHITLKKIH